MTVLIVNHKRENCGVYQFGKRIAETVMRSTKVDFKYIEVEIKQEFDMAVHEFSPTHIIYNWYPITMEWLGESHITSNPHIKHYFIFHDGNIRKHYNKYLFFGADDVFDVNHPTNLPIPQEKKAVLPRPLFSYDKELPVNDRFTVGSFGFGFSHKGFDDIVEYLDRGCTEDTLINLHMPFAYYGDKDGKTALAVADRCKSLVTNPNIELNITHDFRTDEQILDFLAGNDINIFAYKNHPNHGISSVIDYALSVNRPIGFSNNSMFRHVIGHIDWSKHIGEQIVVMENDNSVLLDLRSKWKQENLIDEMEKLILWD